MLAGYSLNFWITVLVLFFSVVTLPVVVLWNPYPSPRPNQIHTARQRRRMQLGLALMFVLNVLEMPFLGPIRSPWWNALPVVLGMVVAQNWPKNRWPVARTSDPIEP
jgi:hypothetical protein